MSEAPALPNAAISGVQPAVSPLVLVQMLRCHGAQGRGQPSSPDTEEDVSIRVDAQHGVLHSCVVDEGSLRMDKEDIRHPNLFD